VLESAGNVSAALAEDDEVLARGSDATVGPEVTCIEADESVVKLQAPFIAERRTA
jgi:hypothetical protein